MFWHLSVRLEAVKQLSVETESEGSVLLRWRGVSGARAYRLVWGPFTGQNKADNFPHFPPQLWLFFLKICINVFFYFSVHKGRNVETVEVAGNSESYTLSRLQPDTEYIVTIIPLYEGNTEGPVATARFKIGRCAFSTSAQHQTSVFLCISSVFPLYSVYPVTVTYTPKQYTKWHTILRSPHVY